MTTEDSFHSKRLMQMLIYNYYEIKIIFTIIIIKIYYINIVERFG